MAIDIREYEARILAMDAAEKRDSTSMTALQTSLFDKMLNQQMKDALVHGMGLNNVSLNDLTQATGVYSINVPDNPFSKAQDRAFMSNVAVDIIDAIESMWREDIVQLRDQLENERRRKEMYDRLEMENEIKRKFYEAESRRLDSLMVEQQIIGKQFPTVIFDDYRKEVEEICKPEPPKKKGFPWFFGNKRRW
ncbi:hypothetical protein CH29_gp45 [Achromobacter phage JWAlpha]|uniref:Uncharacterized protein n=1 Tax=Achromobacter phage JWAlpha TaxID=1416009 RepID=V9VHN3_9CAUD|nr:hypothetical protein CH29_gp45 [Achromobacter phage JWAlpha]AHC93998.1 hypothetical protein JJJB_0045 [Achromobacter phage JWAlpha]